MRRFFILISLFIVAAGAAYWIAPRGSNQPLVDGSVVSGSFGGVSMRIELALTEAAREKGLGGRTVLPSKYGMLFVFAKDGRYGFWMKDTLVPLDMFWLSDKGQVVYIARDVATSTYPNVFYPSVPARYVLETAAGFGRTHGVATGTALVLKKFPSVSQ